MCAEENPERFKVCGWCGTPLQAAPRADGVRKTVTVLFIDASGSTELAERLDPESLRAVLSRYFAEMKLVIERHGGTVEKFIGDAVMAVFGIPVLHEDDALRAVRAAAEIRAQLRELNAELSETRGLTLSFRTALYTGEVVAGGPGASQTLVTGDTVNTAARLEREAPPGEILLGQPTYRLVRDAVTVEPLEPIAAKGKSLPITAYRLVSLVTGIDGHVRRTDAPLQGRDRELATLRAAYERAVSDRRPHLVTVLGTAGVGKSRLVAEFVSSLDEAATVLRGRCLPYGEGITYWPLREIVYQAAGIETGDSTRDATAKVDGLLAGEPEHDLVGRRVAAAIGLESEGAPQEEIFWATRKLFEHLARRRSLVTVWEDIHWAEPTLLDLLEYMVELASEAPTLLLCPARPELLDTRAAWGGGRRNSAVINLEPLAADATERLIDALPGGSVLPRALRERILGAAEGNPLYLEEMLAMLVDEGLLARRDGTWQIQRDVVEVGVPASIKALLAARLDALPPDERAVAQRAAVVGRVFDSAAVRGLASGAVEVGPALFALVRKDLVRLEHSTLWATDAFRFRHQLICDAAYDSLPRADRAALHERFAEWLQATRAGRAGEYEEVLGFHYEQAYRQRAELGETGPVVQATAARAAALLAAAGRHAIARGDALGAAQLLRRAVALVPDPDPSWLLDLGELEIWTGENATAGFELLRAARSRADSRGGAGVAALAAVVYATFAWESGLISIDDQLATAAGSVETLRGLGDPRATARAEAMLAYGYLQKGELAYATACYSRSIESARAAGDEVFAARTNGTRAILIAEGMTPADDARKACEEILAEVSGEPRGRYAVLLALAITYGALGDVERCRQAAAASLSIAEQLGLRREAAVARLEAARLEGDLGNHGAAVRESRAAWEVFDSLRDARSAALARAVLARSLAATGRPIEAIGVIDGAPPSDNDRTTEAMLRTVRAQALSALGEHRAAADAAAAAVAIAQDTQWPQLRGETLMQQALVLGAAGEHASAHASLSAALTMFKQKGSVAFLAKASRLLEEFERRAVAAD
jgi:class 3 adenylate cyclase/tetratricopeptide (TPR) repeat protein